MNQFRAFMSYSHADAKLAARVHRRVEGFAIPRSLLGPNERRKRPCSPIFRDREELSGDLLTPGILEALSRADRLLVLCTPAASQSVWVAREITEFLARAGATKVTAIIAGPANVALRDQLPAPLAGLFEKGHLNSVDIRSVGDGFNSGTLAVISEISGVDAGALHRLDSLRRRRRIGLSSVGVGVSAMGIAGTLISMAYFAAGWVNSIQYTYAALGVVQRGGQQIIFMSYTPGPTGRISRQALEKFNQHLDDLSILPALSILPGGGAFSDYGRANVHRELARLLGAAGQYQEALNHAQSSRKLVDRILRRRSTVSELLQTFVADPRQSQGWFRQTQDRDAWLCLARAQAGVAEADAARTSANSSLEASAAVLRRHDALDHDRIVDLEIREFRAAIEDTRTGAQPERSIAPLYAAVSALPSSGQTDCCSTQPQPWSTVRAAWLARSQLLDIMNAASRQDLERMRRLYAPTLSSIQTYAALPDQADAAILMEAFLNAAIVDASVNPEEFERVRSTADRLVTFARRARDRSVGSVDLQILLADQLLTLAMARAQLGELQFREPLEEAMAIRETLAAGDAENLNFKAGLASTVGYGARVLAAAHECADARAMQQDAMRRSDVILVAQPHSEWRQLSDKRIRQPLVCRL